MTSIDGSTATECTSDAELVAAIQTTNSDAMGMLFARYAPLVRRIAIDILRDACEAEDVTQDVFFEIYRRAHLYDPARGSVRGWLLQYAYHRSFRRKDVLRRRAAYHSEPLEAAEIAQAAGSGTAWNSRAGLPGSSRHLSRQECTWVIRVALAQLPERQRAALELTCFEELSLRDVAVRLQVSLGSARHYYYRGLARLREWAGQRSAGRHHKVTPHHDAG